MGSMSLDSLLIGQQMSIDIIEVTDDECISLALYGLNTDPKKRVVPKEETKDETKSDMKDDMKYNSNQFVWLLLMMK